MRKNLVGISALLASTIFCIGAAQEKSPSAAGKTYPYLLATCPVSGEKLADMGAPIVKQYDAREVRFCCESCVKKFEADKATYFKKIDAEIIKIQLPHYPLKTCVVVPGDELTAVPVEKNGETCQAVDYVYNNRLVRFCCDGCIKKFTANPDQYLSKIDEAVINEQKAAYPLDTCPISGEKLDDSAVNYVAGVSLIRFCCDSCVKKFEKDPMPTLEKLHVAWIAKLEKSHDYAHDAGSHDHH